MEIRVVEEKGRAQIEVTILSGPDDPRVSGIVRQLQMVDGKMTGYVPGTINRRVVLLADVSWIQTDGKLTLIHLVNGETLESSSRLTELEDALKDTAFVRTSRQELVNLDQVTGSNPQVLAACCYRLARKPLLLQESTPPKSNDALESCKDLIGFLTRHIFWHQTAHKHSL